MHQWAGLGGCAFEYPLFFSFEGGREAGAFITTVASVTLFSRNLTVCANSIHKKLPVSARG